MHFSFAVLFLPNGTCKRKINKGIREMAKKQIMPTPESIRNAYVEEYLKRRPDAEEFARFTESDLADFIRKYKSPDFESIYTQLNHNFYDQVRNKIAIDELMRTEDNDADNMYSIHLKTWSGFLVSKAFRNLTKTKVAIEGKASKTGASSPSAPTTVPLFREETEGERKHILKEMDVIHRNPQLRQMCIDKYGYQCQCCGMDFAETYGKDLGANFIEVHHLRMISTFDTDGIPDNFLENLVPLCSNCHSMIHHIKDSEHPLRDLREAYKGTKKELFIWKED